MAPVKGDFGKWGSGHAPNGSAASTVQRVIDLRSDTVTTPSHAMRECMASAAVGDDVFGDDPTVNDLQTYAADLLGKEAALFVTSGTQSNLCALMTHCGRGDEYIAGAEAHLFKYEAGGAAVLGGIQPQTVAVLDDGSLDLDQVAAAVKPDDPHFARTKVLCLENTHNGKVQTIEQMQEAAQVGRSAGLAMHLDGARLWNAAAALKEEPHAIADSFDSVSVCLSKGLGAPVGSILVGSADFIHEAHKWRKMLGGSLRQVGLLAAAGRYGLENNRSRVAEDHDNAAALADGLAGIAGVTVAAQNTNMVFVKWPTRVDAGFVQTMADHGVKIVGHGNETRLVTHLDVTRADIDTVVSAATTIVG